MRNLPQLASDDRMLSVVAAEFQANGRGRQGRIWHGDPGNCLTFSVLKSFTKDVVKLSGLSLVIGLAIIRALKSLFTVDFKLKWPNDVLFQHKKLAGVLIDIKRTINDQTYAVIGIGINFHLAESIKRILDQESTDLFEITGYHINRNYVLGILLLELRNILEDYDAFGFQYFKTEWVDRHAYEGCLVTLVLANGETIDGTVDGVSDSGALNLITSTGRRTFYIGDISLRLKSSI